MTFKEYDVVALKFDIQAVHKESQQPILLQAGQVGTVVINFNNEAYLVDFANPQGMTYAMETVPEAQLMLLHYEPKLVAA
jgi:Domain of unknown function (DUF4926)